VHKCKAAHIWVSLLLRYRPQKDERLSWLSFTHISGHLSATGLAWDMESSPVTDRRSKTVQRSRLYGYNALITVNSEDMILRATVRLVAEAGILTQA